MSESGGQAEGYGESCGRQPHAEQRGARVARGARGHPEFQSWKWHRASLGLGLHLGSASKESASCAVCPSLQYRNDQNWVSLDEAAAAACLGEESGFLVVR